MQTTSARRAWFLPVLQFLLLLCFALPAVQSAARDNDQASFVTGAMQIRSHQVSPFRDELYIFDKQYGTYFLLLLALELFPRVDPVTMSNALLLVFYTAGSIVAFYAAEKNGLSRRMGIILCLIPSLILYAPFLGSSQLSLAFLLLAYPLLLGRGAKFYAGLLVLALATAMRADAVFCLPAIYIAISPRKTLPQVFTDKRFWLLLCSVGIPVLIGRLIVPNPTRLNADHFFILSFYIALFVFAIGIPWIASATLFSLFSLQSALRRKRWAVFYLVTILSLWGSLAYYAVQMYSARYFFPTFFSSFMLLASPRGRCWFRSMTRQDFRVGQLAIGALTLLSILPWLIGLHMFSSHSARLSVADVSTMPTADGALPMGAYGPFQLSFMAHHDVIDHNQESLLSARTVHYRPCPNGVVDLFQTGMANFMMQAAAEQGFRSLQMDGSHTSPCNLGYAELRGLVRNETTVAPLLLHAMQWESAPEGVRPVLSVDLSSPPNATTEQVKALIAAEKGSDYALYAIPPGGTPRTFTLEGGHEALLYTDDPACLPSESKPISVPGSSALWSQVPATRQTRTITVCARQSGAWLPAELSQFMQKSK